MTISAPRWPIPASEGPTRRTSGWVEWQLKQAGGDWLKSASPSAIGFVDAASGAVVPSAIPCGVAALTTIGRGGQPPVSMWETHVRNAMTSLIS